MMIVSSSSEGETSIAGHSRPYPAGYRGPLLVRLIRDGPGGAGDPGRPLVQLSCGQATAVPLDLDEFVWTVNLLRDASVVNHTSQR
jgi:hypothetical protein